MTVIACKNGVIAADTASWHEEIRLADVRKVFRLADGRLFAAFGLGHVIRACARWLDHVGDKPDPQDENDFGGIVISPAGASLITSKFDIFEYDAPFYALGAHEEFLYGAMAAGASAEEAIELAIRYCSGAAGDVVAERLA